MPNQPFDVAVIGLGAAGSAALWQLAARGGRAVGFDRHVPPHHFGSSHGDSRIIRAAYHEHPLYVPLVQRAFVLWRELEARSGVPLLTRSGAVIAGPAGDGMVTDAERSAQLHGLPHERWTARELSANVPALRVPDSFAAVWEPGAGVLAPERCIAAMLREARRESAEIVVDTPVTGWRAERDHVVVATAARDYRVGRILLTAGPWMPEIVPDLPLPLTRERVVQCWFDPAVAPHRFAAGSFPVFLIEDEARRLFYGLPDTGRGVKAAFHHGGEPTTMADVRRRVTHEESAAVREALGRWVPDAAGPLREATVCLYTNTPDGHFLLDRHPRTPRAVIASCCSGHGFKFAPAIGEMLADLATGAPPRFDPAPFGLGRFPAFRA